MQVTRLIQLFREHDKLSSEMSSASKGRHLQDKNRLREIRLEIRLLAGSLENAQKLVNEKRKKDQEEGLRSSEIEAERQQSANVESMSTSNFTSAFRVCHIVITVRRL